MSRRFVDEMLLVDWNEIDGQSSGKLAGAELYGKFVAWARKARGRNPRVFDALTDWILDDDAWSADKLAENEQILMQGIVARFQEQNAKLRAYLKELEPSGVVNAAIFKALDRFDEELSGKTHADSLHGTVAQVFADFSAMRDGNVRRLIAGNRTGPTGTNSVETFGYINLLKDCDAAVQWALFMPETVQRQQNGFQVASFEYRTLPAMRFIGFEGAEYSDVALRVEKMNVLKAMRAYQSEFAHDLLFMHHYGLGVDVGPWHGVWGRFMKADAPVPKGFLHFDFVPQEVPGAGPPYCSRFAFATFSGDLHAMHTREGFDSDAMYDVTRNIMLGEGVNIPYPDKYWTAEVFLNGCDDWSTGYLFSAGI